MIRIAWNKVINAGVNNDQPLVFSDKLQNRNRLCLLCVVFSLFYLFFFLQKTLYLPLTAISTGIVIFCISILLNRYKKYFLSSLLVLINTNYCVLFFSFYLGFDSGIHLYLFTSPLIVLSLFHSNSRAFISVAMVSYILNFFIIIIAERHFNFRMSDLERSEVSFLYILNFVFAILILISLSLYFLFHNEKINNLLVASNHKLKEENQVRKRTEELANQAVHEREILLSEIHHRVKNNLAIISALLNLQIENLKDEDSKKIFEETKDRIYSMSLIHNQLYLHKSFAQIEFAQYITNFCAYLQKSYRTNTSIEIIEDTETIAMDIKTAIPCALILNELVTNSFRHAFKNASVGIIEVGLKKTNDGILFWVSDTGSGMEKLQLQATSMGMTLIHSLVEQIDGKLTYEDKLGSKFSITFNPTLV